MAKHLLVAITGHGFGHAAQTAPVLDALRALHPDLRMSVRSAMAPRMVAQFLPDAESVTVPTADFGMPMRSAIDVDVPASEHAFTALHHDFAAIVATEAEAMRALAPDLVLANVGFVPIAAAARAGIPAIGLSSLNWLGISRGYSRGWREAAAIHAEMAAAYNQARLFIRPTPAMPMPDFPTVAVGPVSRQGVVRRDLLAERLGLGSGERVVLVSLGGIDTTLALETWPALPGVRYVVAALPTPARPDMIALDRIGLSHLDCLASCDAVLTKPGYATITEAGCHGIPTLYVPRGDWPEEPALVDWLAAVGTTRPITRAALERGALAPALEALWAMPRRPPPPPTGNREAAEKIAAFL